MSAPTQRSATTAGLAHPAPSPTRNCPERAAISLGYLSEIERGRKPGSVAAMTRVADALGTTIDALVVD